MSPITHLFASWVVAAKTTDNLRDRRLIALSGILPDLDGGGLLVDFARHALQRGDDFFYYQKYHHLLLHGVFGALLIGLGLMCFAKKRGRVFALAVLMVHLHLFCDLAGSRGPSSFDLWPIHYLAPFSYAWTWVWSHQWPLDAWPNRVLSFGLFVWCLTLAIQKGDSVVGVFNRRADAAFITVIRRWTQQLRPFRVNQPRC
jgi:inner membrane protein